MVACSEEPSASVRTAIIVADAEKLFREGKKDQAIALFDKAASRAFSEGATGRAFQLSRTAAAIVQSTGDNAEAGARLRRLALGNADHPDAPAAYLAAIGCYGQVIGPDDTGQDYADALDEFLDQWPDNPAANKVRWQRVEWRYATHDWNGTIAALEEYDFSDPRFTTGMVLYTRAVVNQLQERRRAEPDVERDKQLVLRATRRIQPLIVTNDDQWPAEWTPQLRELSLALARLHLAYRESNPQYPYRLLTAAASGEPQPTQSWLAVAGPLLIQACVDAGEYKQAEYWCTQLPPSATENGDTRRLSRYLTLRILNAREPQQPGAVLLAMAEQLESPDAAPWLLSAKAAGLLSQGRRQESLRVLREVGADDDPLARRLRAAVFAVSSQDEEQQQAIAIWRDLESLSRAGSDDWRRGRLSRIELLMKRGDREEASKLLKLTQALYPSPDDQTLKARQDALAQRIGEKP